MGSDVLLGHEGSTPVHLLYDHRTKHVAILGRSGYGKTTLLEHLVLADMRDCTAAIVIDAEGDLTKRLVSLAPSAARDKIVLVEPNDEQPFGLNLYERPDSKDPRSPEIAVDHVMDIFNKLMGSDASYRSLIDPGLRNTARLLIANGLTMEELPLLYSDTAFRRNALSRITNRHVHDYWREYEQLPPREKLQKRDPILNKVGRFLEDDRTRLVVAQPTTIPIRQVMDEGGILLLNLAGLGRTTTSLLGMVLLATLERLLHQRERMPVAQRKRVHLYLDEYARFETPATRQMIAQCRKFGLGATIAHQDLSQTPGNEALKVETLIAFQLSDEDAQAVAGQFDCTPIRKRQRLKVRTEPQFHERGEEVWDSQEAKERYNQISEAERAVVQRCVRAGDYDLIDEALRLQRERSAFYDAHCRMELRRHHLGDTTVQDEHGRTYHDIEEEIDQTPAQRRDELANMLTQLDPHNAYCKLLGSDGKPREYKTATIAPAVSASERLRVSLSTGTRIKSGAALALTQFGGWAPDTGFYFKTKEFQDAMTDFLRSSSQNLGSQLEDIRSRSRERFGTPREEVEAQIKRRQTQLLHGQQDYKSEPEQTASLPIDLVQRTVRERREQGQLPETFRNRGSGGSRPKPKPEDEKAPQPPIGRRSPKKKR